MGKKIAEGIEGLILDIKTGNGAFMDTQKKASALGKFLKKIGLEFNINVKFAITDMNQPLGTYSGLLIVFGFIVSAAFGINYVCHEKISKKTVLIIGLTTLAIIGLLLLPVILEFSTTEHLSPFISESEIQTYIIFQVFIIFIKIKSSLRHFFY